MFIFHINITQPPAKINKTVTVKASVTASKSNLFCHKITNQNKALEIKNIITAVRINFLLFFFFSRIISSSSVSFLSSVFSLGSSLIISSSSIKKFSSSFFTNLNLSFYSCYHSLMFVKSFIISQAKK